MKLLEQGSLDASDSSMNDHPAISSSTVTIGNGIVRIRDALMMKDYGRLQSELDAYVLKIDYPLPPSAHYLYALAAMRTGGDIVSGYYHAKAFIDLSDDDHPHWSSWA